MNIKTDFAEASYQRHASSYANYMQGEEKHSLEVLGYECQTLAKNPYLKV